MIVASLKDILFLCTRIYWKIGEYLHDVLNTCTCTGAWINSTLLQENCNYILKKKRSRHFCNGLSTRSFSLFSAIRGHFHLPPGWRGEALLPFPETRGVRACWHLHRGLPLRLHHVHVCVHSVYVLSQVSVIFHNIDDSGTGTFFWILFVLMLDPCPEHKFCHILRSCKLLKTDTACLDKVKDS